MEHTQIKFEPYWRWIAERVNDYRLKKKIFQQNIDKIRNEQIFAEAIRRIMPNITPDEILSSLTPQDLASTNK